MTLGDAGAAITLKPSEAWEARYPGGAVLSPANVAESALMPGEPSVTWQLAIPR